MTAKKKTLTFEAGMQELERLTARLGEAELTLEESMSLYEQGVKLHAQLEQLLDKQRRRNEVIDPDTAEIEALDENENGVA